MLRHKEYKPRSKTIHSSQQKQNETKNKYIKPSEKDLNLMQIIRALNRYSANLSKDEYKRVVNCMYDIHKPELYHITNTNFSKQFNSNQIIHCSETIEGAINATRESCSGKYLVKFINPIIKGYIYNDEDKPDEDYIDENEIVTYFTNIQLRDRYDSKIDERKFINMIFTTNQ